MPASSLQFGFIHFSWKHLWIIFGSLEFLWEANSERGMSTALANTVHFLVHFLHAVVSWLHCQCWSIWLPSNCSLFSTKKVKRVTFSYLVWSTTTMYSCFLCLFQVSFSSKRKVEEDRGKVIDFMLAKPDVIWPFLVSPLPGGVCTEQSWSLLLPTSQLCRLEQSAPAEGKSLPALSKHKDQHLNEWVTHETSFSAWSAA